MQTEAKARYGRLRELTEVLATAQEERDALEVRWRAIAEASPNALVLADAEGRIEFTNGAARELFGPILSLADMMPPRYRERHRKALQAFSSEDNYRRSPYFSEPQTFHGLRPSGDEFVVELQVTAIRERGQWYFVGSLRDVDAVLRQKSMAAAVLDSMHIGLILADRRLRLLAINPKMEQISGSRSEEVVGRIATEVWPHLVENGLVPLFERALAGETVQAPPNRYVTPAGATGWARGTYSPWTLASGEIAGMVATIEDVTEWYGGGRHERKRRVAGVAEARGEAA